jgi:hypothetical protein
MPARNEKPAERLGGLKTESLSLRKMYPKFAQNSICFQKTRPRGAAISLRTQRSHLLLAAAHRAQADALEIEAAAKRRLAVEYHASFLQDNLAAYVAGR